MCLSQLFVLCSGSSELLFQQFYLLVLCVGWGWDWDLGWGWGYYYWPAFDLPQQVVWVGCDQSIRAVVFIQTYFTKKILDVVVGQRVAFLDWLTAVESFYFWHSAVSQEI